MERHAFGGIMVSHEVSVVAGNAGDDTSVLGGWGLLRLGLEMEMVELRGVGLGTWGEATREEEQPETYVDRLIAVCVKARG